MTENFKAVVFEKNEVKYRDISILGALLTVPANQHSKSDVKKNMTN